MTVRATLFYVLTSLFIHIKEHSSRSLAVAVAFAGRVIGWVLDFLTPVFNYSIRHDINYYVKGWAIVVVFTFIINASLSIARGTFLPDSNAITKQFMEDWPDLVNYLVVCPLYVLVALQFVTHAARLDLELAPVWIALSHEPELRKTASWLHLIEIGLLCIAISTYFVWQYMKEFLSYSSLYWSVTTSANGVRRLGFHGFYYTTLNGVLNLFMVVPGLYHFRMLRVAHRFGSMMQVSSSGLGTTMPDALGSEDRARELFKPLSDTLALSKSLIAIFMLNAITWSHNEPEAHGILDVTVLALLFLGIGLFAYPRYHIQFWLYRRWKTTHAAKYPDIRQPLAAGVNALADSIMLGTTAVALFLDVILRRGHIQWPDWLRDAIRDFLKKLTE